MSMLSARHVSAVFFVALFLHLQVPVVDAQESRLRGVVLDAETQEVLPHAYLAIRKDTLLLATLSSDEDGRFLSGPLAPASYNCSVSHLGYRSIRVDATLRQDEETDLVLYLSPMVLSTEPVVITDRHAHSWTGMADVTGNVLRGRELQRDLGHTLASTLRNEAGLAMQSMGPAPARPVIRGLGGSRVYFSEDGMKTVDLSATSPDHAVTIEPFSVDRVEVLRGPKILMNTPSAFGGVVNVVRHEIPFDMHENVFVTLGGYGESANAGALFGGAVEAPAGPILVRGEATRRFAGDVRTPTGVLGNSYSNSSTGSVGASWIGRNGLLGASYRSVEFRYGVPGGFAGAHPNGVDIEMERRQYNVRSTYEVEDSWVEELEGHLSRSYYHHKELEKGGFVGSEFLLVSYNGFANMRHGRSGSSTGGTTGMAFEYRDFDVGGYVFTTPSISMNLAPYLYERLELGPLGVEAAVRYSWDRVDPRTEKPNASIGWIRRREFHSFSASVAVLHEVQPGFLAGASFARSTRVPTIEELFSEGPHLAAYSYEVGNPDLPSELGHGGELFIHAKSAGIDAAFTVFYNSFDRFIIPRNTGATDYSTFLPIYASEAVGAVLYGAEGEAETALPLNLKLHLSFGWTQGSFRESGLPLPQIPPLKGHCSLDWSYARLVLGVRMEAAAAQTRVDEFEFSTAGYSVFAAYAQWTFSMGSTVHNIVVNFDNMFDMEYRNHLSRIKSVFPEAGRSVRATYKLYFES